MTVWSQVPAQYQPTIITAAQRYGIRPELLAAVGSVESGYQPQIINGQQVSSTGAVGAFQFEPATARQYGVNPTDFTSSANGAAHYLSVLMKEYGSENAALQAYNSGSPTGAPGYASSVLTLAGPAGQTFSGTGTVSGNALSNTAGAAGSAVSGAIKSAYSGILSPIFEFLVTSGMVTAGGTLLLFGAYLVVRG